MVILKKIKASTLMETLVATVLIVIIFALASTTLNQLFSNSIKHSTRDITAKLNELQYQYTYNRLQLPYKESLGLWQITIEQFEENNQTITEFEAVNSNTKKTITEVWKNETLFKK